MGDRCRTAPGSLPSGVILAAEALFLVELGLLIYCVLSVVTTPPEQVQHLPKLAWLVLVVVLPLAGGIAWLVLGRPRGPAASLPYEGNRGVGNSGVPAAYDRPGRAQAASPEDDEAFLRQLRERADAQRAEAARLRREAAEKDEAERRAAWRKRHPDEPPRPA